MMSDKHIVAVPFQAWGHARPLANLATRLVKISPIYITLLVTNGFYDKAVAEVARNFGSDEGALAQRIRVISLGEAHFHNAEELNDVFDDAWRRLDAGEEFVCKKSDTHFAGIVKPQAVVLDFFMTHAYDFIRVVSGSTVKVHIWCSGLTAALFHLFGPEKFGGKGNVRAKAEEEARKTGVSASRVILRELAAPCGELVKVPGIPPMYDYEYYPQPSHLPPQMIIHVFSRIHDMLQTSDGIFLYTAESYEPKAVAGIRDWFGETKRAVYVCGPLVPHGAQAMEHERTQSQDAPTIEAFLDSTLASFGERCLLYISFGSLSHDPEELQKVWALLDVVVSMDIPFVMSFSAPRDIIPSDMKEKLDGYSKGLLSSWTPQQTILEHRATGWFLTHGGHNSVLESVTAGVPMIFWPFAADQPLSTVHVTENLGAGYELIEARSGAEGLKPIYRNRRQAVGTVDALRAEIRDVLQNAYGEDGARKRENLQRVTAAVRHEWEEGGVSRRDMTVFVEGL